MDKDHNSVNLAYWQVGKLYEFNIPPDDADYVGLNDDVLNNGDILVLLNVYCLERAGRKEMCLDFLLPDGTKDTDYWIYPERFFKRVMP